jgi:hypothetical protein
MSKISKEKQKIMDHYKKLLATMIDDNDICRWLGSDAREKIIKYSDLKNYNSINDLIPEEKGFRIILTESSPNCGHWCAVLKYKDILEWFDSYGVKVDGEFKYIPKIVRKMLGQDGDVLTYLLTKTKRPNQNVYYNKRRLQSNAENINTCGRWVIARILSMLLGFELDDFINKVDEKIEDTGKPSDILVCDWIV